jgi:hypothetical protein
MLARLEHQINFNLYNLLKVRVTNQIVQFKIEIEFRLFSYLQTEYNLNSRFKQAGNTVLEKLDLIQQRAYPHPLNPNRVVKIDKNFFLIRLYKKKDKISETRIILGPAFIYIKFGKLYA